MVRILYHHDINRFNASLSVISFVIELRFPSGHISRIILNNKDNGNNASGSGYDPIAESEREKFPRRFVDNPIVDEPEQEQLKQDEPQQDKPQQNEPSGHYEGIFIEETPRVTYNVCNSCGEKWSMAHNEETDHGGYHLETIPPTGHTERIWVED